MTSAQSPEDEKGGEPWRAVALALAVLLAGFLLIETPPVAATFELITKALAIGAVWLLTTVGFDMVRTGVELRDATTGHALVVTSACDGSGLIVAFFALLTLLKRRSPAGLGPAVTVLVAVGGVLLFNLVRIVVLFLSIGASRLLLVEHLYVAPLLSSLFVAGIASHAAGKPWDFLLRDWRLWLGCAFILATGWYFVSEAASCLAAVPMANLWLWLSPIGVSQAISCGDAEALVRTSAILSLRPPAFVTAAFHPEDYLLATPLVLAALALRRDLRFVATVVLSGLILFSLAMAAAALTAGYDAATGAKATTLSANGMVRAYHPPADALLAVLKAGQNTLVHFNLFLLPFLLAASPLPSPSPPPPGAPRQPARRRRRKRRNR